MATQTTAPLITDDGTGMRPVIPSVATAAPAAVVTAAPAAVTAPRTAPIVAPSAMTASTTATTAPAATTTSTTAPTTDTTAPPVETPEQIAARANSMKTVEVDHGADGSVKTDAAPPVETPEQIAARANSMKTVEPSQVVTATTPLATDSPAQAAARTQAQQDLDLVTNQMREWATMKDDPSFRAVWNRNLMNLGLQNQAAADALQMRISQDPSLRGQPAGTALMQMAASQAGMSRDELLGQLTVQEADRIRDMNKYGIDGLYKLTQDKMTQDDRDVDFYGTVIDRMLSSGDTAGAEKLFNEKVLPLLGSKGVGLTFDQFRSPAERRALRSGVENAGLTDFRDALDRDDLPGALDALESAYPPAVQVERGKDLIAKNDVATINQWLKDAGYDEITDTADLIGREDDVFTAQQVSKGLDKLHEDDFAPQRNTILGVLKSQGMDITDPDVVKAVNNFLYNQLTDPTTKADFPWDSDTTSWQYKDWEIFNPQTGATVDKGGEFYDPTKNPEPAPGSAEFKWRQSLDNAWTKYLRDNPESSARLSRDDWFSQFKTAYTDYTKKNPGGSLDAFLNGSTTTTGGDTTSSSFSRYETKTPTTTTTTDAWKPGEVAKPIEDRPAAINEGEKKIKKESDVSKINFEDPDVKAYLDDITVTLPAQIGNPTTFANAHLGEWIKVGDQFYRVDQGIQGRYVTSGNHVDVMKLTRKDGTTVYMRKDGKFTTTPPPSSSDAKKFAIWYEGIGA